jgi:hypothetical protein
MMLAAVMVLKNFFYSLPIHAAPYKNPGDSLTIRVNFDSTLWRLLIRL